MYKLLILLAGIAAIIAGAVFNDKAKYPAGTTGSKWGIPLIVLGGILLSVFLFLQLQSSGVSGGTGWKKIPGVFSK